MQFAFRRCVFPKKVSQTAINNRQYFDIKSSMSYVNNKIKSKPTNENCLIRIIFVLHPMQSTQLRRLIQAKLLSIQSRNLNHYMVSFTIVARFVILVFMFL
ncbi:PREDICTED: uncharacterized protein LOC108686370 [Atta colombica]|uniref:uncharacterized protein LOC108686370 n=1 Tax=Atta colombica TaxID=520822 RepID=UPI00084C69B7|nr:PREDICTED: uncharacterized protein LOC108686370 [Atta colombica]